jgi:hypothetical protein
MHALALLSLSLPSSAGTCFTELLAQRSDAEHSPLLFAIDGGPRPDADAVGGKRPKAFSRLEAEIVRPKHLLLCLTPKAGSSTLRAVGLSVMRGTNSTFVRTHRQTGFLPWVYHLSSAAREYALRSPGVIRLMFVRHPVSRILSGFIEAPPKQKTTARARSPSAFHRFVANVLTPNYDPFCGKEAQLMALRSAEQHFLPPQHCRCGITCGVNYTVVRIEDTAVDDAIWPYVHSQHLPPAGVRLHSASPRQGVAAEGQYLVPKVLDQLNMLTALEQRVLGYQPYVVKGASASRPSLTPVTSR